MEFYSTNNRNLRVDLRQAVMQGLAPDNGLYMPVSIPKLPDQFFRDISRKTFQELSLEIAQHLLGKDLLAEELKRIVDHTIQFEAPLVNLEPGIFALELFHGPTLAFKDFGARFLSGLLGYFAKRQSREIVILVATSGDTGSAVANGFLNVPGTRVIVLYPSGKVSEIQEKQFTTLGGNITALEIEGTFDDCQALVKSAFHDKELNEKLLLTSANSINIARLIPQSFYYFWAFAKLQDQSGDLVFSVPSGNFGNLTAGLMAKRMGLPVKQIIAATNINDIFPAYLQTGLFSPRPSQQTISNAMDVGSPSNFYRMLDLYDGDITRLSTDVLGYSFTDEETRQAMRAVFTSKGYVLDPHGAVGYLGLKKYFENSSNHGTGVFLETAHPGKFRDVVEETIQQKMMLPERLEKFLMNDKISQRLSKRLDDLKDFLLA